LISGVFGWVMLIAIVLAIPDMNVAVDSGGGVVNDTINKVVAPWLAILLFVSISLAHFLCGLATVTSTSRMVYAFARDGGLPLSAVFRRVGEKQRAPVPAIWLTATAAILLVALVKYATIAAFAAVLLYISYVLPTALGLIAHGRTWTRMGPWNLGRWYRPLAVVAMFGCAALLVIGVQPPNDIALPIVLGFVAALIIGWFAIARRTFPGPPKELLRSEAK
jgi:amino acid transporter